MAALPTLIICIIKRYKALQALYIVLFVSYIAAVICLTIICGGKEPIRRYNFIPFVTIISNLKRHNYFYAVRILEITMMFIPMGVFTELKRKDLGFSVIVGFLFSLMIEVTQLITMRGVFDIDDLIFNTLGTIIGFLLVSLYRKRCARGKLLMLL